MTLLSIINNQSSNVEFYIKQSCINWIGTRTIYIYTEMPNMPARMRALHQQLVSSEYHRNKLIDLLLVSSTNIPTFVFTVSIITSKPLTIKPYNQLNHKFSEFLKISFASSVHPRIRHIRELPDVSFTFSPRYLNASVEYIITADFSDKDVIKYLLDFFDYSSHLDEMMRSLHCSRFEVTEPDIKS